MSTKHTTAELQADDLDLFTITDIDELSYLVRKYSHETGVHVGMCETHEDAVRTVAGLLQVIRVREQQRRAPAPAEAAPVKRYPLWCWDSQAPDDEHRYCGPYESEAAALMATRPNGPGAQDGYKLRRCRRVTADELGLDFDWVAEVLDEKAHTGEPNGHALGNFEDAIVTAKPGADEALRAWAREYFDVGLTICEGDE